MESAITVKRVDSIPGGACVCHYDELDKRAKECLPRLVRNGMATTIESEIARELLQYDVIKFTEYYRVVRVDSPAQSTVSA